jgi:hypothetical protein
VGVFDEVSGFHVEAPAVAPAEARTHDDQGRVYVDLNDAEEFRRFILERRAE